MPPYTVPAGLPRAMSLQQQDSSELIIRGIQTIFKAQLQTYINTEFAKWTTVDLADDTGEILPVAIESQNIFAGSPETIKIDLERLPMVTIDVENKTFGKSKIASAWTENTYSVSIVSILMGDDPRKLYWGNMRFTEAIVSLLSAQMFLGGVARSIVPLRVVYSNPIGLKTGWFRGSHVSLIVYGFGD